MSDYSALEKLYRKGIMEFNPKDYINGTSSNVIPEPNKEIFLPDNRFHRVDGSYIREQIDRDLFESSYNKNKNKSSNKNAEERRKSLPDKLKQILTSKITAGIVGTTALILSGRYILKLLHIIK